jgi:hypothetical protein
MTRDTGWASYAASWGSDNVDFAIVLVNDETWGACAKVDYGSEAGFLFSAIGPDFEQTMLHELGHVVGPLEDEYPCIGCDVCGSPPEAIPPDPWVLGEPTWVPNLTTQTIPSAAPWYQYNADVPPTTENDVVGMTEDEISNEIGLFVGGGWYSSGVFRPAWNCKMRCVAAPFCKVCREAIREAQWDLCPEEDNYSIYTGILREGVSIYWEQPWRICGTLPPCLICPLDGIQDTITIEVTVPAGLPPGFQMKVYRTEGINPGGSVPVNLVTVGFPMTASMMRALWMPTSPENYLVCLFTGSPPADPDPFDPDPFEADVRLWVNQVEWDLPP